MRRYEHEITDCPCGMVHKGKSFISQDMAEKSAQNNATIHHKYREICGEESIAQITMSRPRPKQ